MIIQGKVWDVAKNQPLYFPVSESQKVFRTRLEYPGREVGKRPCVRVCNIHGEWVYKKAYWACKYCIVDNGHYSIDIDVPKNTIRTCICLGHARDQHSSGGIRDEFRCGEFPDSPWTIGMSPIPSPSVPCYTAEESMTPWWPYHYPGEKIEPVSQTYDFLVESNVMDYNQEVLGFDYAPKPYFDPDHFNVTIKITMRIIDSMAPEIVAVNMWIPKQFIEGNDDAVIHGAYANRRMSPEMEGHKFQVSPMDTTKRTYPLLDSPDNIYTFEWTGKFYRNVQRTFVKLEEGVYPVWCGVKRTVCTKTNGTYSCPFWRPSEEELIVYRPEHVGDLIIGPIEPGVQFNYSDVRCEGVETT